MFAMVTEGVIHSVLKSALLFFFFCDFISTTPLFPIFLVKVLLVNNMLDRWREYFEDLILQNNILCMHY